VYTQMKLWTQVRQYVLVNGHSKREACRKFNIHWDTLKKMLAHPQPPGYTRSKPKSVKKIDRVLPILHRWLEQDRQAPLKQRHTRQQIYRRLVKEHNFDGRLTIVKDAVRAWRKVNAQTFVPLKHPPGEAQVDFGEASIYLNGVLTKVALFVMSLPYSDVVFIRAYPRECTESFQDGHVQAFLFFGGVPTRISYDHGRLRRRDVVTRGDERAEVLDTKQRVDIRLLGSLGETSARAKHYNNQRLPIRLRRSLPP